MIGIALELSTMNFIPKRIAFVFSVWISEIGMIKNSSF